MTLQTAKRVYSVRPVRRWGDYIAIAFIAEYKPVNQKTGRPWQASRRVPGANVTLCGQTVYAGRLPFGDPQLVNAGDCCISWLFASEEDAIAAILSFDKSARREDIQP